MGKDENTYIYYKITISHSSLPGSFLHCLVPTSDPLLPSLPSHLLFNFVPIPLFPCLSLCWHLPQGPPSPADLKLCSTCRLLLFVSRDSLFLVTLSWAQEDVHFMLIGLASHGRGFRSHVHPFHFPQREDKVQRGIVICSSSHRAELRKQIQKFCVSLAFPGLVCNTSHAYNSTQWGSWASRGQLENQ